MQVETPARGDCSRARAGSGRLALGLMVRGAGRRRSCGAGTLLALELECALLAGVGHDHRQHALVYIDNPLSGTFFPSFPSTFPWCHITARAYGEMVKHSLVLPVPRQRRRRTRPRLLPCAADLDQ